MSLALRIEDDPGQNDGPSESVKLCYPAGWTARGACLYIAEHPSEIQGFIRNGLFHRRAGSISIYVARNCRGNGIDVKTS